MEPLPVPVVNISTRVLSNGVTVTAYYATALYDRSIRDTYQRAIVAMMERSERDNVPVFPCQVVITTVNDAIYSKRSVEELEVEILRMEDKYEPNHIDIKDLTITATTLRSITPNINRQEQVAFGGDIDVEELDNTYIVTLLKTYNSCIKLSYVTWLCYRYNSTKITDKKYLAKEMTKVKHISSFSELNNKYIILFNKEQVNNISCDQTLESIVMYYEKEHVSLVIHKDHLDRATKSYLRWIAKPSYVGMIKPILDNSKKFVITEINTMDLECVREYNEEEDIIRHIPVCLTYSLYDSAPGYVIGLDCIERMFTYLSLRSENITIWMHNSGGYDAHIILDHILHVIDTDLEQPISLIDTDQSIISLIIKTKTCNITIKDSFRLLSNSLSKLCETFKVENPKLDDVDSTKFTYDSFKDPKVLEYAVTDVISLKQVLNKFKDTVMSMGYPNPLNFATLTALAKNIFFSQHYSEEHSIRELNRSCYNFIKPGYYGGIVQAFKKGLHTGIYTYDIKSDYAYCGTKPLPCGEPKMGYLSITITSEKQLLPCLAFYHCYIVPPTNKSKYVMPIHLYRNKDLIYVEECEGINYEQCIFSESMRLGLRYGYSYRVSKFVGFSETYPLLESYNRELYDLKLEAEIRKDSVMVSVIKLLLNALYGWFGFNKYNKDIVRIYSNNEINLNRVKALEEACEGTYKIIDNIIYTTQKVDIDIPRTNIAIAAAITSYARIHLFNLAKEIQDMGYEIYYCDTDSIKCKMEQMPINNPSFGSGLGQLDKEHKDKISVECNIYAKKMLTTKYYDPKSNKYQTIITSKGIKINRHYIDHINIEKSSEEYKEQIAQYMKQRYLEGKPLDVIHGQIYKGKSNRIKDKPGLYEKTMIKRVKLQ